MDRIMKLTQSKKMILLSRILYWGGMAAGLIACVAAIVKEISGLTVLVVILSFIVSIVGSIMMEEQYRCPYCRTRLMKHAGSVWKALAEDVPRFCPNCGTQIIIERED